MDSESISSMIINNLNEIPENIKIVIAGSGPAGISLALSLEKKGIKSLIIESGDEFYTEISQDRYNGEVEGNFPNDLNVLRHKKNKKFCEALNNQSITTNNNGIIDRGSNRDPPLLYREVQNKVDQTTDKIFKPGLNVENTNDISTELLTGENVDISHFSHNNMVPYFGSKIPNVPSLNNSGMILDHKNGNGSQMINKKEQAPLFEPKKNMQWTHGTPNMNDFFKEHYIARFLWMYDESE